MRFNGKKIVCLVGESGCGKSTLENELVSSGLFEKFITTTTRKPRENEISGEDFFYTTKSNFESKLERNELMTSTFFDNEYYGMEKTELEKLKKKHCIAVLDVTGCINLAKELGKESIIFYYISTEKEKREKALAIRFKNDVEKIERRIANDLIKFEKVLELDQIVQINNNYDDDSLEDMVKKIVYDLFIKNKKEEGDSNDY